MEKIIWSNDATVYDFEESRQIVSDVECIDVQDVDDDAVYRYINDDIYLNLQSEECNLDVPTGRIIVLATLGLWHGKVHGSRILPEQKLSAILHAACRDSEEYTVYYDTDDGEVKARDVHHDGVNRYVFREMATDTSFNDRELFLESAELGAVTLDDIKRFTVSLGPRVEAVYGWRRELKSAAQEAYDRMTYMGGINDLPPLVQDAYAILQEGLEYERKIGFNNEREGGDRR